MCGPDSAPTMKRSWRGKVTGQRQDRCDRSQGSGRRAGLSGADVRRIELTGRRRRPRHSPMGLMAREWRGWQREEGRQPGRGPRMSFHTQFHTRARRRVNGSPLFDHTRPVRRSSSTRTGAAQLPMVLRIHVVRVRVRMKRAPLLRTHGRFLVDVNQQAHATGGYDRSRLRGSTNRKGPLHFVHLLVAQAAAAAALVAAATEVAESVAAEAEGDSCSPPGSWCLIVTMPCPPRPPEVRARQTG